MRVSGSLATARRAHRLPGDGASRSGRGTNQEPAHAETCRSVLFAIGDSRDGRIQGPARGKTCRSMFFAKTGVPYGTIGHPARFETCRVPFFARTGVPYGRIRRPARGRACRVTICANGLPSPPGRRYARSALLLLVAALQLRPSCRVGGKPRSKGAKGEAGGCHQPRRRVARVGEPLSRGVRRARGTRGV